MNRERLAWTVSVMLIALLAFQLPGGLAQRDDDYAFVRTLVDIHRQVANNYADSVDEQKLREGAIEGMLQELDPFTMWVPPARHDDFERALEGTFRGVGIQLNQLPDGEIEVVTPIDGSPAFLAGVMAGDVILKVNGESIQNLRLPDVIKKIGGPVGTQVRLTVRHATGEEADLTMTRQNIVLPTIKGYERKSDNSWDFYVCDSPKIGYVRVTMFTSDTHDKLRAVLETLIADKMQGLILDLRFNPGGRLEEAEQMVDLFIDSGVIVSIKGRARAERVREATSPRTLPYFPMIVLVNEHSASASEIVAGSLMDNQRALVVGSRTYGKGSVQEVIPLDSKSGDLKLTVAYYYLPSGKLVHRKKDSSEWGVEPQIDIPMDEATQRRVMLERFESENFKRPLPKSTTRPSTQPVVPTTQPADVQLQRSVDTMIGLIVLKGRRLDQPIHLPTTQPAISAMRSPASPPTTAPAREQ